MVPVSPFEEFSVIFTATNGHDVEMFVRESAPPPVKSTLPTRSVSPRAKGGKVARGGSPLPCLRKIYINRPCGNRPTSAGSPSQARTIRYILERWQSGSSVDCRLNIRYHPPTHKGAISDMTSIGNTVSKPRRDCSRATTESLSSVILLALCPARRQERVWVLLLGGGRFGKINISGSVGR